MLCSARCTHLDAMLTRASQAQSRRSDASALGSGWRGRGRTRLARLAGYASSNKQLRRRRRGEARCVEAGRSALIPILWCYNDGTRAERREREVWFESKWMGKIRFDSSIDRGHTLWGKWAVGQVWARDWSSPLLLVVVGPRSMARSLVFARVASTRGRPIAAAAPREARRMDAVLLKTRLRARHQRVHAPPFTVCARMRRTRAWRWSEEGERGRTDG